MIGWARRNYGPGVLATATIPASVGTIENGDVLTITETVVDGVLTEAWAETSRAPGVEVPCPITLEVDQ